MCVINPQRLNDAYALLPHGPSLRVIKEITQADARQIQCVIPPALDNPLWDEGPWVSSFTFVEYAAQAAAIHGILMGAQYDPANPAYIGAVKDIQIEQAHYAKTATVIVVAQQQYSERDGAIYEFEGFAGTQKLLRGRLILKK